MRSGSRRGERCWLKIFLKRRATAGDRNVTMFTLPGLPADQSEREAGNERPMRDESEHNTVPAATPETSSGPRVNWGLGQNYVNRKTCNTSRAVTSHSLLVFLGQSDIFGTQLTSEKGIMSKVLGHRGVQGRWTISSTQQISINNNQCSQSLGS